MFVLFIRIVYIIHLIKIQGNGAVIQNCESADKLLHLYLKL